MLVGWLVVLGGLCVVRALVVCCCLVLFLNWCWCVVGPNDVPLLLLCLVVCLFCLLFCLVVFVYSMCS